MLEIQTLRSKNFGLGINGLHDSPLEGDGFELPVPREKSRYPVGAQLILL